VAQNFTSNERLDAPPAISAATSAITTKGKENSYVKPRVDKCYRCGKPTHKSNECPKKRPVNITDYEDEHDELIETEPDDFKFVEEEGEAATCVVQWLLCNQKSPDTAQRHQIFYSMCSVENKVCNLIIDNDVGPKAHHSSFDDDLLM